MPTIKIQGMSCGHCQAAVLKALEAIKGLKNVEVDLQAGEARWQDEDPANPVNIKVIADAIRAIGFEA